MSILSIRDFCHKIFAPILLSPEKRREEKDAKVIIRRRVEVTVERETISVIVPGRRPEWAAETTSREGDFRVHPLELPAPQSDEAADSGPAEHPEKNPSD